MATRLNNKLATAGEQIREAYRNGATLREIGEVHEVSAGTIRNKLIELGEEMRRRGRRKKEQVTDTRVLPTGDLPSVDTMSETTNELNENEVSDPTPALSV